MNAGENFGLDHPISARRKVIGFICLAAVGASFSTFMAVLAGLQQAFLWNLFSEGSVDLSMETGGFMFVGAAFGAFVVTRLCLVSVFKIVGPVYSNAQIWLICGASFLLASLAMVLDLYYTAKMRSAIDALF